MIISRIYIDFNSKVFKYTTLYQLIYNFFAYHYFPLGVTTLA